MHRMIQTLESVRLELLLMREELENISLAQSTTNQADSLQPTKKTSPDISDYGNVTDLIQGLHIQKDWYAIAEKYAAKHGHDADYWFDQWQKNREAAATFGKEYHKHRQGKATYAGPIDLDLLTNGEYRELRIFSHYYKVKGRADKVVVEDNFVDIYDIKTSKEIVTEPTARWNPKLKKKTIEKYLPPCSHLANINFNDAQLQLSIYGFILEMYGFKVRNLVLEHVQFKGRTKGYKHLLECLDDQKLRETSREPYEVEYLRTEAQSILRHYRNLNKQW